MALPLLLLVLLQPASRAVTAPPDRAATSVPVPTNLTFEAYNFNTLLHWGYPSMHETPVFTVMVKTYNHGKWISACNTSLHHCDISSQISDPSLALWARVTARLGQKESAYAESKEFILCKQGKIGPPTLSVSEKGDHIITDVYHPLKIVSGEELEPMYDDETCFMFTYNIYIRIDENETTKMICDPLEEDYNDILCRSSISVGTQDSKYCVSAEGVADLWGVTTERSQDVCITISKGTYNRLNEFLIPAITAFVLFLLFIVVFVYCHMKEINPCKRKSIMLPKSLVTVVKSATSEVRVDPKYICPVTYQPIVLENEKVIPEELLCPAATSPVVPEDRPEKEHRELPSETEVVATDTDTSDVAPEGSLSLTRENSLLSGSNQSDPCSITLKSYHSRNGSDSGLVESGSFGSDSEFPPDKKTDVKTETQEPITLRNTTTSFGYDRPHVLVDLLVGEDSKESLIGYRLTTESKEFS